MLKRVFIAYANAERDKLLRLEREQGDLNRIINQHGQLSMFSFQNAVTIDDLRRYLTDARFDVVHFSGHGTTDGFQVCAREEGSSSILRAAELARIVLLNPSPPTLLVAMCCYSLDSVDALCEAAPFVITVDGRISDATARAFTSEFYKGYIPTGQIDRSFRRALSALTASDRQKISFSRRALKDNGTTLECFPMGQGDDSIIVDLGAVIDWIRKQPVSEAEFLHRFRRKIRVHSMIFRHPMDRALIPLGPPFFAEFSWANGNDVVYCTNIFAIEPTASVELVELWARLLVSYNDLASDPLRPATHPSDPASRNALTRYVHRLNREIGTAVVPSKAMIVDYGGPSAAVALESLRSNASRALDALEEEDDSIRCVTLSELSLSYFHQVIDSLQPPRMSGVKPT